MFRDPDGQEAADYTDARPRPARVHFRQRLRRNWLPTLLASLILTCVILNVGRGLVLKLAR